MSSEDLQNLFTPFGEVTSAKIVTDKFNNDRSKGFGFVEMADDEAARAAIAQLHDTDVMERKIVVNESAELVARVRIVSFLEKLDCKIAIKSIK